MTNFVEYVISELKNKRISKDDAAAIVKEFARGGNKGATLHPLLHRNTSDLARQCYECEFTGREFFFEDHQIAGDRVMPGVAYLEMARAAVANAWPAPSSAHRLELNGIVWARPMIVRGNIRVWIELQPSEQEQVAFRVLTRDGDAEIVHCQGRAAWSEKPLPAAINLDQLNGRIHGLGLNPKQIYDVFQSLGVAYGSSFRALTNIVTAPGEILSQLQVPETAGKTFRDFVLHPALLDGALQSCIGLEAVHQQAERQPRVPFALEWLRIVSACPRDPVAWLRHSPGHLEDKVLKLDIDLCDQQGNLCVQMRGFSARTLSQKAGEPEAVGAMLARPVWQRVAVSNASSTGEFARHEVVVCELPEVNAEKLGELISASSCVQLCGAGSIAECYSSCALACLEQVQRIFRSKPAGKALLQVVTPSEGEGAMLAGLSGLLRTAGLENPQLVAQTIMVPPQITVDDLVRLLQQEKASGPSPLVCYRGNERFTQVWEEAGAVEEAATLPYADDGIYLITGGLGGLGKLFAREILQSTANARVLLTGRSAGGEATAARLADLGSWAGRVSYRQLDLSDLDAVRELIGDLVAEGGKLRGILHGAGMIADNFLINKSGEELQQVLGPKVQGTYHLDLASAAAELDWFVMFSSLSGVFGNVGQADYAAGNGFMDQFALHREEQVKLGRCHGHTVSLDWGLWQAGGMQVAAEVAEVARRTTGMEAMATAAGLAAFARGLRLPYSQLLVAAGDKAHMRRALAAGLEPEAKPQQPATQEPAAQDLSEKTQDYLRKQLSALLKLPANRIDPQAALEQYGIDSILAIKLTNQLEETFGPLSKTLFFEYQTIAELAKYFTGFHAGKLASLWARPHQPTSPADTRTSSDFKSSATRRFKRELPVVPARESASEAVAIIGLSGRYPEAVDIEAYWSNLREGRDCIVEVPRGRWDWRKYWSEDRTETGRHSSKWGGFISGVDEFDPLFFHISPGDAEFIDPQERLFLEHAWMAMEDAGYTRATLQSPAANDLPGQVGVYAGAMYIEYQLLGAEATAQGKPLGILGSAASIANRVSYVLNLHGPSMTLDTMCSSSLSAIHLACQDLKQGRTSVAIAGGVNVSIHPNKYLVLSAGQFISSEGHCQSFGEGGDGYIPGEGVGVVVLKRLSDAERDGDHIYGVIRGSALNHGGKTNGYTVPNPQAQASAISRALAESGVDARQISYIEAHGTGTRLGDPIEIAALSKAFAPYTDQREFCLIGSAKSNIGHCESAAGIAGLTKVLLQMQHGEIVPSLHSEVLNPHIDFSQSPFVVNQRLRSWERPVVEGRESRRIAGISSFGAGGSNAHLIVEEYPEPASMAKPNSVLAIVISARTAAQLQEKARELLRFVSERPVDLVRLAYTLQVGREGMEERVGLVVSTVAELEQKLTGYVNGATDLEEVYAGQVRKNKEGLWLFNTDADLQQTMEKWLEAGKLTRLLELWVQGVEIDWAKLYKEARPRRMSLPAYPFARERYWIEVAARQDATTSGPSHLHPLLHRNTSDLREQRYSSTFTGQEFFLRDHQVNVEGAVRANVLPAVAYLEIARAAMEQAVPVERKSGILELRNIVWARPMLVAQERQLNISLSMQNQESEQVDYEVYSAEGGEEVIHSQGSAVWIHQAQPQLDLDPLQRQMARGQIERAKLYETFAGSGIQYGPAHQAVVEIALGEMQLTAKLRLPSTVKGGAEAFWLHPSMADGALQACIGLAAGKSPSQPRLPFAMDRLRLFAPCTPEMTAWVRYAPGSNSEDPLAKLDIDVCDGQGNVCVEIRGFSARPLHKTAAAPAFQGEQATPSASPSLPRETDTDTLDQNALDFLRQQLSKLLKVSPQKIDPEAPLEQYGIDSILAVKLTNLLEEQFGSLSKTLFFEYQTVSALAKYFVKAYPQVFQERLNAAPGLARLENGQPRSVEHIAPLPVARRKGTQRFQRARKKDVAIVGLAGRYPQAEDLQQFWTNLKTGRDCITEIPSSRWDQDRYYHPDRNKAGKSYSKWGGFVDDVDKFDPLFFNISPREAMLIDPQERLFLETAWQTIEDAGYSKEAISGRKVGVFVGVMWGHYELLGIESNLQGETDIPASSFASIANRVSYFFDFRGPSLAVDTMCSSSLTAIHLACDSLRKGEAELALAGGVNLTLHPYKYLNLSQGRFAASDGKCRSFGEGGDGYVPGEGVGALLLKPLEDAIRDHDHIYAVIKSSALNHGGKTNGYTVPNPNAQAGLIVDALGQAHIEPGSLGYLEAHGTGTSLGDPIEIAGLSKAFAEFAPGQQSCPIGSVKSNIGHLEAAAGIAAVTKTLLQIKHRQLVPSLHADPPNPNINFERSPFYVQRALAPWPQPEGHPRRAGVSSFGAGGSNAHVILEEHEAAKTCGAPDAIEAFLLSAKDRQALRRYVVAVVAFLAEDTEATLESLAYSSQVGRTAMECRLAVIAATKEDLRESLVRWFDWEKDEAADSFGPDPQLDCVFSGSQKDVNAGTALLIEGQAGKILLDHLWGNRDLKKIAGLWVLGVAVDWSRMPRERTPLRASFPTYPFARERYWLRSSVPAPIEITRSTPAPRGENKQTLYLDRQWSPRVLNAGRADRDASGPILLFDTSESLSHGLQELAASHRSVIVRLRQGSPFQEMEPGVYALDLGEEEHYHLLVKALLEKGSSPVAVIHSPAASFAADPTQDVPRQLREGVYALLFLTKALIRQQHHGPIRIISAFSSTGELVPPALAAIGGFLKTLTLESPRFLSKVVDTGAVQDHEQALLIWNELYDSQWTSTEEIRYRSALPQLQQRSVKQLAPLHAEAGLSSLPLREKGVYIITGGLGGLGLIFAEYLAKKVRARLILVGRSAPGEAQREKLAELLTAGAEILSIQADVSLPDDMARVVREAKAHYSELHGLIHAAGMNRDAFLLKKSATDMQSVLAPKVYGTLHLDAATQAEPLDWFVLFSSVAGALGNVGQCDYAFGNAFMDGFAEYRESLRVEGKRSGRTLSIGWPLWEQGGMKIPANELSLLERQTGICPLPTPDGLRGWEVLLRGSAVQPLAIYGIPSKLAAYFPLQPQKTEAPVFAAQQSADPAILLARTVDYLRNLIGEEIRLSPERIGETDAIESLGIDSIAINQINAVLEKDLGEIPKTLLYEHQTVRELAKFLVHERKEALLSFLSIKDTKTDSLVDVAEDAQEEDASFAAPRQGNVRHALEPIAIIGIHGRYPRSASLEDYWENLKQGRSLIEPIPADRWNGEELYDPDPSAASQGKIYCKWGGFLSDHDKFDPAFFHIPPEEAAMIDPQERLFLESVWSAIEDAGYTRESLKRRFPKSGSADVGVFVGVTTNSYSLWSAEEAARGNVVFPGAMPWSIANRVSYFFDFNGPSMPVDTACSSSLVALHLACESLRQGRCRLAIAGGVNLYLHPAKYQSMCQRRMLAAGGECHSYGAGDNGFVPGEGVGTLVLKPLSQAVADQDRIYAVISGTAFEHSGRSHGYSAPNPNAQARLVARVLEEAGIDPEHIGYVEGHGTGTQLGDSIEVAALTQAFRKQTVKKQFCSLGSVKANMGHAESAAGVAALTKVILQLQSRQLVPTISSGEPNPDIPFASSPFYLQHHLSEWPATPGQPRRALINSFGAGGVNACAVLEEFETADPPKPGHQSTHLFVLSAKDRSRLREYVDRLLGFLRGSRSLDLGGLCFTLQTGREAMEDRLAIVAADSEQLIDRLQSFQNSVPSAFVHAGTVAPRRRIVVPPSLIETASKEHSLNELAALWSTGGDIDWSALHPAPTPRRTAVPTYPFARERVWFATSMSAAEPLPSVPQLHPLISFNSSTLRQTAFTSILSAKAFYAVDHKVNQEPIFPGAGFIEIACISGSLAGEQKVRKLQNVVWMNPLSFRNGPQTVKTVLKPEGEGVDYLTFTLDDEHHPVLHSEGRLAFHCDPPDPADSGMQISLPALKAQCDRYEDGAALYEKGRQHGLDYGPSFASIQEIWSSDRFALTRLKMPSHLKSELSSYLLHPSMIDGVLQTAAGLLTDLGSGTPYLPFALDELEIYHPLRQACYAYAEHANFAEPPGGAKIFNLHLLNESGDILLRFRKLCLRPVGETIMTTAHTKQFDPIEN